MPHTGRPQLTEEEFDEISRTQHGTCRGINCSNQINEYSPVQHKKPRNQGGSDKPENLEILCPDCVGYHSHRLGVPNHVWRESKMFLDSQPHIFSFNHLVRLSLQAFIDGDTENVLVDQRQLDEFQSQFERLESSVKHVKKLQSNMRPHFQELAKFLNYDIEDRRNLTKKKGKNISLYQFGNRSKQPRSLLEQSKTRRHYEHRRGR